MKLAIADPPYLGRSVLLYGDDGRPTGSLVGGSTTPGKRATESRKLPGLRKSDVHPDAAKWDLVETHRNLVDVLVNEYDGWAIALAAVNLFDYIPMVPRSTRICVWNKQSGFPSSAPRNVWEPVLVRVPDGRRALGSRPLVDDLITKSAERRGFPGAKPPAWTRWVLDMLGYDPESDTVDDLFGGSGAVTAEINQQVLL